MRRAARTTLPPNACPIDWCPRHTPKMGNRPARSRTQGSETPASFGVHGPGEMTMPSGAWRAIPSTSIDACFGAELAEILDEIEGERIVIVDDEDGVARHGALRILLRRGRRRAWTVLYGLSDRHGALLDFDLLLYARELRVRVLGAQRSR